MLAMFLVHSPYPWLEAQENSGAYASTIAYISGMVAPVFLFLAGISVAMMAGKASSGSSSGVRARVLLRSLEILVVAYMLQATFWACGEFRQEWTRILKVDVLNCIGASMFLGVALCWPAARKNWKAIVGFWVLLLGAQVLWRLPALDILPDGIEGYLVYGKKARFPIFPYGAWVLLGMVIGPIWVDRVQKKGQDRGFWIGMAALAVASLLVGMVIKRVPTPVDWGALGLEPERINTSVHHFFHKMGVLFMLFVGARLTASIADRFPVRILVLWGRTSLFAYCVHLVIIYYGFGPFVKNSLVRWEHLVGVVILAVIMFFLSLAWQRWAPPSPAAVLFGRRNAK